MPIDQKLVSAIETGNLKDINDVISKKVDVNTVDENGNSPLHLAAKYNKPLVFCALLQAGGKLDTKNKLGQDPYDCADNNLIADMIIARWEMELFSHKPESQRYIEKKEEYEATITAVPIILRADEALFNVLISDHTSGALLMQSADRMAASAGRSY